jgi:plastocyanin
MRMTSMVAGLTMILTACGGGGENRTGDQQAGTPDTAAANAPAANAPGGAAPAAGTGKSHDVKMVLDGSKYRYDPENLTIKSGDVVRYYNTSGGPHNVSFWGDSIPSGAADVLKKNMPNQMAPLEGPLLTEPNAVYEVSFAGAPKGEYKYYCLPHLALGMKAKLTVQ